LCSAARAQVAAAEVELLAKCGTKNLRRLLRFALPQLRRAARSHLAARELEHADAQTFLRRARDRRPAGELEIVRMSSNEQQIDRFSHKPRMVKSAESGSMA